MNVFMINTTLAAGILMSGFSCHGQEKYFRVIGEAKGVDTGSVTIYSFLQDSTQNSFSGIVSHGKFIIKGNIDYPIKAFLILNNSLITNDFILQPGDQNIYFDATNHDSFSRSFQIKGSLINDEYKNGYQKLMKPYYASLDSCYIVLDSLIESSINKKNTRAFAATCNAIESAKRKIDSVKKAFIKGHPASFVSLWTLYSNISDIENLEFVTEHFDYLDEDLKNSVPGKHLAHRINIMKAFLNGQIFPEMHLVDSMENSISIKSNLKGKYTLIDFWFSKCGPCISQFPKIRYLYEKYGVAGFDVIGISVDKAIHKKDWLDAIVKYKLNWKQFWDRDGKEKNKYLIDTFPTTFLLNNEGRIIKKNILLEELEILLENNLE